jgi:hypothetical protein
LINHFDPANWPPTANDLALAVTAQSTAVEPVDSGNADSKFSPFGFSNVLLSNTNLSITLFK